MKIIPVYINQQSNIKMFCQRNRINKTSVPASQDGFTSITKKLQKHKFNPAFGAIPAKKIYKLCDELIKEKQNAFGPNEVGKIILKFYNEKIKILVDTNSKSSKRKKSLYGPFKHELGNIVFRNKLRYWYSENGLQEFVQDIKHFTTKWINIEKWKKYSTKPIQEVFEIFEYDLKPQRYNNAIAKIFENKSPDGIMDFDELDKKLFEACKQLSETSTDISSISGKELLNGKKVKNPRQLYNLLSQPLLNAIKYGEGKPFEIEIEKIIKNNKEIYYAKFINPETKPIPNAEIDKILEGTGYRAEATQKIDGSGFGFQEIIRILKENKFEDDILNLIQKDRDKGVCVRIPLIGIC